MITGTFQFLAHILGASVEVAHFAIQPFDLATDPDQQIGNLVSVLISYVLNDLLSVVLVNLVKYISFCLAELRFNSQGLDDFRKIILVFIG